MRRWLLSVLLLLPGRAVVAAPVDPCAAPPVAESEALGTWLRAGCYQRPALGFARDRHERRQTGPTRATAPHGRVTVYYSPAVVAWLKAGRPVGGPADGALIVKEMFTWEGGEPSGRAAMLKQRGGSYSGWFFWPGEWAAVGCIGCHGSAASALTFADLSHLEGGAAPATTVRAAALARPSPLVAASHPAAELPGTREPPPPQGLNLRVDPAFVARFPRPGGPGPQSALPFPSWREAKAPVPGPPGPHNPPVFLSATSCMGCHDAQVADEEAGMVQPSERSNLLINVSPYAEWSASLMGLAGRDPVFHAQLESEKALRPQLAGFLDDTCYRCHGVAGLRQLHLEQGRPFDHAIVYARGADPLARFGALAREGVTCTACHRMAAAGLGTERTFTGAFATGPADELYGPYRDNVKAQPMKQALGITPKGAPQMKASALCGSCHSVILPQVPLGYRGDPQGDARLGRDHEQTTYLEWRSSAYQDEEGADPARARSCQSCHMPTDLVTTAGPGQPLRPVPLQTKIASIEEYLPHVPGSLPAAEITLAARRPYGRHTLVGLNVFVSQLFLQFPGVLGIPAQDPIVSAPAGKAFLSSLKLAQREQLALAQRSAQVELCEPPRRTPEGLRLRVRVSNLAGHKLPTGVGFRRAFLELQVQDAAGRPLWVSGRTDGLGVLVGADGAPLASEFTRDPRLLQPHHREITRPEQVQIYEERTTDQEGRLTTSFLGRFARVKDNRLLPLGFAPRAADARHLQPVGLLGQPVYEGGRSVDEVRFLIPLTPALRGAAAVRATLYYQALPPGYLADRFSTGPFAQGAQGPETQRLHLLLSAIDLSRLVNDWKLPLATTGAVALSSER